MIIVTQAYFLVPGQEYRLRGGGECCVEDLFSYIPGMSTETMQQTPLGTTFLVKFGVSTHYMHVHCKNKLVGFNHRVWVYMVYVSLQFKTCTCEYIPTYIYATSDRAACLTCICACFVTIATNCHTHYYLLTYIRILLHVIPHNHTHTHKHTITDRSVPPCVQSCHSATVVTLTLLLQS